MSISLQYWLILIGLVIGGQVGGALKARATYRRLQNEASRYAMTSWARLISLNLPKPASFNSPSVSPKYWHTVNAQPGQPGPQRTHRGSQRTYLPRAQAREKKKGSSKERRMRTLLREAGGSMLVGCLVAGDAGRVILMLVGCLVAGDAGRVILFQDTTQKTHLPKTQTRKKKEGSSKERHVRVWGSKRKDHAAAG
eukprot:g56678.t1